MTLPMNKLNKKMKKDDEQLSNAMTTMTTLSIPHPAEFSTNLGFTIKDTTLPTKIYPKILGLTFASNYYYYYYIG